MKRLGQSLTPKQSAGCPTGQRGLRYTSRWHGPWLQKLTLPPPGTMKYGSLTQSESKWNIAPLNLESKTSSLGAPDHAPVNQKGTWWIAAQGGWLRGGPFNELMSMAHIPHLQHSLPHIQMRWLQNRSAKLWACGATPGGGTKSSKATCQMRLQSEQLPSHRKLQTSLPPPRQPHKMVKWGDTQIFGTVLLGAVRCCYNQCRPQLSPGNSGGDGPFLERRLEKAAHGSSA